MFSEKEIAYLQSQRLARIATVSADGKPDVAPGGFTFKSGASCWWHGSQAQVEVHQRESHWGMLQLLWMICPVQIHHNLEESKCMGAPELSKLKVISGRRNVSRSHQNGIGVGESKRPHLTRESQ
jgi:hypothetical protein